MEMADVVTAYNRTIRGLVRSLKVHWELVTTSESTLQELTKSLEACEALGAKLASALYEVPHGLGDRLIICVWKHITQIFGADDTQWPDLRILSVIKSAIKDCVKELGPHLFHQEATRLGLNRRAVRAAVAARFASPPSDCSASSTSQRSDSDAGTRASSPATEPETQGSPQREDVAEVDYSTDAHAFDISADEPTLLEKASAVDDWPSEPAVQRGNRKRLVLTSRRQPSQPAAGPVRATNPLPAASVWAKNPPPKIFPRTEDAFSAEDVSEAHGSSPSADVKSAIQIDLLGLLPQEDSPHSRRKLSPPTEAFQPKIYANFEPAGQDILERQPSSPPSPETSPPPWLYASPEKGDSEPEPTVQTAIDREWRLQVLDTIIPPSPVDTVSEAFDATVEQPIQNDSNQALMSHSPQKPHSPLVERRGHRRE
ncbi:hypothetical protein IWZ01DRAFT_483104 [Phyllosticta capitalensis]